MLYLRTWRNRNAQHICDLIQKILWYLIVSVCVCVYVCLCVCARVCMCVCSFLFCLGGRRGGCLFCFTCLLLFVFSCVSFFFFAVFVLFSLFFLHVSLVWLKLLLDSVIML